MSVVEELTRAREAYERREWAAAYEALSRREPDTLTSEDFGKLAIAALLVGRRNDCIQAMQRAYQLSRDAGDNLAAVRCAFWLAMILIEIGEDAVSSGWYSRAERLLSEIPGDVVERGWLTFYRLYRAVHSGAHDEARDLADEVVSYGARFGEADLTALGLSVKGAVLIFAGQVREGTALMDEAMLAISTGEVSTFVAGQVYCLMIDASRPTFDFTRVTQWTEQLTTWCAAQPELVIFTGQCAVHRGQIMRLQGAYDEALGEFDRAVQRYLQANTPAPAGLAYSERGDVLRIRGDLAGAEAAYAEAARHGHDPQPGLALLWLAQGRTSSAVAAVQRLLAEPRFEVHRAQLLAPAVDVLLAADLLDQARTAAGELRRCAGLIQTPAVQAMAAYADGAVALAAGDPVSAVPLAREAQRLFAQVQAAYEVARCRVLLGRAYRDLGDGESATVELTEAAREFARLGTRPAHQEVARLLGAGAPGGLTAREVEVLRLVAAGRSNAEIAGSLVLSEKTVARHLSNIFGKLNVTSRTAAAAFAHEHHLT